MIPSIPRSLSIRPPLKQYRVEFHAVTNDDSFKLIKVFYATDYNATTFIRSTEDKTCQASLIDWHWRFETHRKDVTTVEYKKITDVKLIIREL